MADYQNITDTPQVGATSLKKRKKAELPDNVQGVLKDVFRD